MASGMINKYADGSESGWKSYANADVFTGTMYYRKIGSMVEISISPWFKLVNEVAGGSYITIVPTNSIPVGYRPSKDVMGSCFINTGTVPNRSAPTRITTSGSIVIYSPGKEAGIPKNINMTLSAFYFV